MTAKKFLVILPWPHPYLFPNRSKGAPWGAISPLRADQKEMGWGLALGAGAADFIGQVHKPVIHYEIRPPKQRGRPADYDGVISACKAYVDGICSALQIDDGIIKEGTFKVLPKKGDGEVEISLEWEVKDG